MWETQLSGEKRNVLAFQEISTVISYKKAEMVSVSLQVEIKACEAAAMGSPGLHMSGAAFPRAQHCARGAQGSKT